MHETCDTDSARPPQIQVWGPYNTALGAEPPAGPRGLKGQSPSEAETLLAFGCSMEGTNLPSVQKIWKAKNQIQFVLSLQKMKFNRLQSITDYCRLHQWKVIYFFILGKLLHVYLFYILNIFFKTRKFCLYIAWGPWAYVTPPPGGGTGGHSTGSGYR